MDYKIVQPNELLGAYIKNYWYMRGFVHSKEHYQRIVPSGLIELTFYFESTPEYQRNKQKIISKSVLSGQSTGFYDIRVSGKMDMLSVLFTPIGAKLFFEFPMSEISDSSVPLDLLDKKPYRDLTMYLQETRCPENRIKILEACLINKLRAINERYLSRIQTTVHNLKMKKGMLAINELAGTACLSPKQYKRIFKEWIGLGPKLFSRIVRFQHAVHLKQLNPNQSLTALAYESGFYDQAHMIQDFKALSGLTPRQFFSDNEAYSDLYSQ